MCHPPHCLPLLCTLGWHRRQSWSSALGQKHFACPKALDHLGIGVFVAGSYTEEVPGRVTAGSTASRDLVTRH